MKKFLLNNKMISILSIVICIIITTVIIRLDYEESRPYFLAVTMNIDSSPGAAAKVYFDVGKGYNEKYSTSMEVRQNSDYEYLFNFPGSKNIKSFRIDPIDKSGKAEIKEIKIVTNQGAILRSIPLARLEPIQQISNFNLNSQKCSFEVSKDDNDPVIIIQNSSFSKFDGVVLYLLSFKWIIFITAVISLAVSFFLIKYFTFIKSYFIKYFNTIILSALAIIFAALVSFGITGSSLEMLFRKVSSLTDTKMEPLEFHPQAIRSDEYLAGMPWVLAQVNHKPQYPIINKNIGCEGQNMLVAGNGAPVRHLSSLAKPITWGFFLFDLKRGLAWMWFFSVFSVLLALWWLLNILLPEHSPLNFSLSLIFCISSYNTAWSLWPSNVVFPSLISLCLTFLIFKTRRWIWLPFQGILLGLSIAGFALILYPPWQTPLAYLCLAVFIGVFLRDRLYLQIDLKRILTFILALGVGGIILYTWWIDAKDAIDIMSNTVYPGRRFTCGGDFSLQWLLRGFTNITSLYYTEISNPCEIASFYYLFLPLTAALFIYMKNESLKKKLALIPIFLFTILALEYMCLGFPEFLARYSFWYMATPGRTDLALGVAYILMCGIVITGSKSEKHSNKLFTLTACLISLIWTAIVLYVIITLHTGPFEWSRESILLIATFLSSVFLIQKKSKSFIITTLLLCLFTTISFNPISVAPNKIGIKEEVNNIISDGNSYKRVLSLNDYTLSVYLYSAGVPTVNGIFMYPQLNFWEKLDPQKKYINIYNRFQSLNFVLSEISDSDTFKMLLPHGDTVIVSINPETFSFPLTGAEIVIISDSESHKLFRNSSVKFLKSISGYSYFEVSGNKIP